MKITTHFSLSAGSPFAKLLRRKPKKCCSLYTGRTFSIIILPKFEITWHEEGLIYVFIGWLWFEWQTIGRYGKEKIKNKFSTFA